MGSVQFQIAPRSSLHSGYLQAPSHVVSVTYRDFDLLHQSFLKRFPLFISFVCQSVQCLIFALTQADRGGLLFRLLVPSRCGRDGRCFPRLHCSGSQLLYREPALRCMWFQFSGVPQKRGLGCACVLCLPRPRGSGSQELEGRTLPRCVRLLPFSVGPSLSPRPRQSGASRLLPSSVGPSLSFRLHQSGACAFSPPGSVPASVPARAGRVPAPCVSQRPSRRMSTVQSLRRSLVAPGGLLAVLWGCRLGRAHPFPLPLPPASRGWAGSQRLAPLDSLGPFVP